MRTRQIDPAMYAWLMSLGFGPGLGEVHYLVKATSNYYEWLHTDLGIDAAFIHHTPANGLAAMTADRNDVLVVYPGTYTLTAALTWNKSNTHMVGAHSNSPWSNSIKIQHTGSTAISPVITVSGSDVLFNGLHLIEGGSNASQFQFLKNTGSGNLYKNIWFEGPTNATQGAKATVFNVTLDGGGNTFQNCIFGTTAHNAMNGAAQINWTGSCYRSTFNDCMFFMSVSAVTARFLYTVAAGSAGISGPQFFNNCKFVSWWTAAADQANAAFVSGAGGGLNSGVLVFDPNCIFVGFNAIGDTSGNKAFIYSGHAITGAHGGANAGIILRATGSNP